ncbi:MAG: heparinase II/III-family protein, partial [Armatimonadetes bacterium]|nr:heparinase II/III-family protein [Armatimonadota bacterium]
WKMDFDHPYKVICPVGGESYPSNDFYAYLKGGMKDKSLLTGDYVDDGWGYKKNPDDKFAHWFVGYYAHWMARNYLHPALDNLSQAYLITGDAKYAHKCALLLWQLATYYPDYQYEKQSSYGKEVDPSYKGRLLYHTWETWTVETAALAYDAVFPALAGDTALQKLSGLDGTALAKHLEDRMLRTMADDIIGGSHRIQGNWGMHQKAALLVALALDTKEGKPTSQQIVDWVLDNRTPSATYTDTGFRDMLVNLLHRDGIPFESPSYNCGWMVDLAGIADLLIANGVDLWQEPRLQSVYAAPIDMLANGQHTTPLGDSNNMFSGGLGVSAPYQEQAYARLRRPEQAKAMVQCGGTTQFSHDLFRPYLGDEIIKQAEAMPEEVGVTSSLLPGLGFLTLQAGKPGARFALSLYYGYYVGHIHFDLLNMDLYAYGWPMTPDLGYPETADTYDPRRFGFLAHTVVHNTVMVDATRSELGRGQLVAFHPGAFAQMAEVTDVAAYPGKVQDYRRTAFLIEADDEHAYTVDVFRVAGGKQHDWLVHGTEAEFSSNLPLSEPRQEGTLAGPDVPYGIFYDDEKMKDGKYGHYYYNYKGSAFQWLYNVQEARAGKPAVQAPWVQWTVNRDPKLFPKEAVRGATLRSHLVPQDETVFACDGVPVRRPQFPDKLKWVVRRRTGEDLRSAFVTVDEMFVDASYITGVKRLPVAPDDGAVAIEVQFGDRRHIIFSATNVAQVYTVDGKLRVQGRGAVLALDAAGKVTAARLFDGKLLALGATKLTGAGVREAKIASVDYAKGIVTLGQPCLRPTDAGRWVPVRSATHEASVKIEQVLSPTSFSIGAQDLRTGRGTIISAEGNTVQTNAPLYFCEPGMTVVDERGQALARVKLAKGLSVECDGPLPATLPDADKDGAGRFTIMAIGAGDGVEIGSIVGE